MHRTKIFSGSIHQSVFSLAFLEVAVARTVSLTPFASPSAGAVYYLHVLEICFQAETPNQPTLTP